MSDIPIEEQLKQIGMALEKLLSEKEVPRRCPYCGGPLVLLRPTDISGVPELLPFCEACYEREE